MQSFLLQPNAYLQRVHEGQNSLGRYIASIIILLIFFFVLASLPFLGLNYYIQNDSNPSTYFDPSNPSHAFVCPAYLLLITMGFSFAVMTLGVFCVIRFIHKRSLQSLFAIEAFRFGRMFHGLIAWMVLLGIITFAQYLWKPELFEFTFNSSLFWPVALACLFAIPIQASTEEIVFRGYFFQSFGAATKKPIVPLIIVSVLFSVAHFMNPEIANHNLPEQICIALSYFTIAALAAIVTLRDNSLALACGLHVGNNLFLTIICNYSGSALTTQSIFTLKEMLPYLELFSIIVLSILFYYYFFGKVKNKEATS